MTESRTADDVLARLKQLAEPRVRAEMESRYGIVAKKAFGVPMAKMQQLAAALGPDHELAAALWETGWYEARMVASMVDDPALVTPAQMDRWCLDFDNWAICDTVCFKLFDRTPHAFPKVDEWAGSDAEFVKRGAFALLACVALHDRESGDEPFLRRLPLVEHAATDDRNFVKKGVIWALRAMAHRNAALAAAVGKLAAKLAGSADATARSIGKTTLRELGHADGAAAKKARKRAANPAPKRAKSVSGGAAGRARRATRAAARGSAARRRSR